jgi:hypothetical protein
VSAAEHDTDPAATHQAWMNQVFHAPTPVCPEHPDADLVDEAFSFWCVAGEHAVSYSQVMNGDHE